MMNHKIGDNEAEEEDVFLFPQSCSGLHSPIPEGDKLERTRRRKKVKGAVEGGIGPIKNKLTAEQVSFLERNFELEQKLDCGRKDRLAAEVGLDPRQVAVWFQNRRSRWKSKQLEEEYHKLKSAHEFLLIEKSQLQAEVCNLKEQLLQAQLEIQRLNAQAEGVYANGNMHGSPLSSMSPDNASHPHVGGFGVEELDDYSLSLNVNMDS